MKNINKYIVIGLVAMSMISCGGEKETSLEDELGNTSLNVNSKKQAKMLDELIQSIPSPVEMNTVIKSTGVEFSSAIMHKTSKVVLPSSQVDAQRCSAKAHTHSKEWCYPHRELRPKG